MDAPVNGSQPADDLVDAQKELAQVCMQTFGNPQGAAISAFVNSLLLSARVDAIAELIVNPPNATWTMADALSAATLHAVRQKTEQLRGQSAQQPRILRAQ